MKDHKQYKTINQFANAIARKCGYGRANELTIGNENKVSSHVSYGYRKNTTGQYVPNKYLSNFGWKNTYYQHAQTTVMITEEVARHFNLI